MFFFYYLPAFISIAFAIRPRINTESDKQFQFSQHQKDLQNIWDRIDVGKVEKQLAEWNNDRIVIDNPKPDGGSVFESRQGYGDIPHPIPTTPSKPTQEPISSPEGCLAPRGQFPSQRSCSHYLNCWDDVVIEQECPGGLLFNEYTSTCDFEYNTYCNGRPGLPPKPELSPGSTVCPDPNGRYRSSTNCSEFFFCVYGKPVKYVCPGGLVYNEDLAVCDYPYRVDCRGASVPAPWTPKPEPEQKPQPQPQPQPRPPQNPYYPPPQYPQQPYPQNTNPWLNNARTDPDPWHQRPAASQIEMDQEKDKIIGVQQQQLLEQLQQLGIDTAPITAQQDAAQKPLLTDPWEEVHKIPAELTKVPCRDGDVHRLTDSCSSVVVCRRGRPQLVQCPKPKIYDRPSDSCRPFSIAKC